MLIIDSRNEAAQIPGATFDWPGAHCLFVAHGAQNPLEQLERSEDWFVFEFTSDAVSTLSALRDIIVATDRTAARANEPFIFMDHSVDATSEIARAKALVQDSKAIDYTLNDQNDLQTLICGEDIAGSELFVTFFRFMTKDLAASHTRDSLDMMSLHLGN